MPEFDELASIRRFFDAENEFCRAAPGQRDITMMRNELDPEVVVEVPDSLPHGGTWRGHTGFGDLFDAVTEHFSEFVVGYNDTRWHRVDDGRVLTDGVLHAVLSATGKPIEMRVVSLFTFTERGLSHLVHYYKDTAAIVLAAQ